MGLIKSANTPASITTFSMADIESAARRILLRAQQQAEQLLAAAQVEAERLKELARVEGALLGREEGLAQGLEEGRAAGHAAAVAEHKPALATLVQTLTTAVATLDQSRRQLHGLALSEVVKLATAIARRVTKRQATFDPKVLEANLADVMKLVVHASDVRVAIHPSQRQRLEQVLPQLQLSWPNLEHVELVDDPALSPGGCRVFTTQGQVDADIDTQLDRLVEQLMPAPAEAL